MKNIIFPITMFFIVALFLGCSGKTVIWPLNGTKFYLQKYKLEISDSSQILAKRGNNFYLITPPDSLIINKYEISYEPITYGTEEYFRINANQQIKNTLSPEIIEYYGFEGENVLLIGFTTGDSLKPYAIFDPPLKISSLQMNNWVESRGKMKIYNSQSNSFAEKYSARLIVKNIARINMVDSTNNTVEPCNLREVILSRDAMVGFGKNNLIVPDAIVSKTKLLINLNGYPIAEWSIKVDKERENSKSFEKNEKNRNGKLYMEYIKYRILID